jgi:hypothetical protein
MLVALSAIIISATMATIMEMQKDLVAAESVPQIRESSQSQSDR